jgi:hypothetical protein
MRRRKQQAPGEPGLEVARDPESREDAAERRRLQQDEDELERRVALGVVESRDIVDARQSTDERGEEEQRERELRDDERRVREHVVQRAPGNALRD